MSGKHKTPNNMIRRLRRGVCLLIIAVGEIGLSAPIAHAQMITPVHEFSFGSFAIKNNNTRHMLRVSRTGGVTADSEFIIFTSPTPAEYSLSGFTPLTQLNVSIPDSTVSPGGGGTEFTIEDFTPTPSITTDGSGNATLLIGASLYTSGSGGTYVDGSFSGTIDITISY